MSNLVQKMMDIDSVTYKWSPVLEKDDSGIICSAQHKDKPAWHAFRETLDFSSANSWYSGYQNASSILLPHYIGYDFGKLVSKVGVVLFYDTYSDNYPIDFKIQCFVDEEWKDLVEVTNFTVTNDYKKVFLFDEAIRAQKFRYIVSKNKSNYAVVLHSFRLLDEKIEPNYEKKEIVNALFEENILSSNGNAFKVYGKNLPEFLEDDIVGKFMKVPKETYLLLDDSDLNIGESDFTLDCWMYYYSASESNNCAVGTFNRDYYCSNGVSIVPFREGAYVGVGSGPFRKELIGFGKLPNNSWAHYAFVRKEGVFYTFLNGVLINTLTVGPYKVSSTRFVINSMFADVASTYCGTSCYKTVRFCNYARWIEDFTPPNPKEPEMPKDEFIISENYKTEDGITVKTENSVLVPANGIYNSIAPVIEGYSFIGYKIDNGAMQVGNSVSILAVDAEHTVTFIYKKINNTFEITEFFQLEDGTVLKPAKNVTVVANSNYNSVAPAVIGYVYVGYKIDGGSVQASDTATISAVAANHSVMFIYKKCNAGEKTFEITKKFQLEDGTVVKEESSIVVLANSNYNTIAPAVIGYAYNGYKLDNGILQSATDVTINNVTADHVIVFIYSKKEIIGNCLLVSGMVMHFASPTAPEGWLVCDGSEVLQDKYADLYGVIGNIYGEDCSEGYFRLPDLRGEFIRGYDYGRGIDEKRMFGGQQSGSLVGYNDSLGYSGDISTDNINVNDYSNVLMASSVGLSKNQKLQERNTGAVRPRNVAMLPCIKY